MNFLKMCVGIDVAQKELVCSFGGIDTDLDTHVLSRRTFTNSESGFKTFLKWIERVHMDHPEPVYIMEATGVYHQKFAHWLFVNNCNVVIVMPNKISNFMRGNNLKITTKCTWLQ